MYGGPITTEDVVAAIGAVHRDKIDSDTEGSLWLSVFVGTLNARLRARPTASDEAIEAAARDVTDTLCPSFQEYLVEDFNEETKRILRRHFGASDTGGER